MRPYRGKRKDNNKWVYGGFYEIQGIAFIIDINNVIIEAKDGYPPVCDVVEVDPATVSQSCGKYDVNNKEVFAGDISKGHGVLVYEEDGIEGTTGFYWKNKEGIHHYEYLTTPVKIISNIHLEQENG